MSAKEWRPELLDIQLGTRKSKQARVKWWLAREIIRNMYCFVGCQTRIGGFREADFRMHWNQCARFGCHANHCPKASKTKVRSWLKANSETNCSKSRNSDVSMLLRQLLRRLLQKRKSRTANGSITVLGGVAKLQMCWHQGSKACYQQVCWNLIINLDSVDRLVISWASPAK